MKVRFTDEAFECLDRIEESYPKRSQKIVARIIEKTALLVANPQLGRMVPEHERPDLRELIESELDVATREHAPPMLLVDDMPADEVDEAMEGTADATPPIIVCDPFYDVEGALDADLVEVAAIE